MTKINSDTMFLLVGISLIESLTARFHYRCVAQPCIFTYAELNAKVSFVY